MIEKVLFGLLAIWAVLALVGAARNGAKAIADAIREAAQPSDDLRQIHALREIRSQLERISRHLRGEPDPPSALDELIKLAENADATKAKDS